jgi:hypothetical protein
MALTYPASAGAYNAETPSSAVARLAQTGTTEATASGNVLFG